MSNQNAIRPEDILPDGVDSNQVNGKLVRKGTIAAFLANTDILENPQATEQHKQNAIQAMKELASDVIAIGLHKHVTFKNTQAEQILIDTNTLNK
ncbi:MAG: hypothetical protein ABI597_13810 [Gammaproteobacteria bacterium]